MRSSADLSTLASHWALHLVKIFRTESCISHVHHRHKPSWPWTPAPASPVALLLLIKEPLLHPALDIPWRDQGSAMNLIRRGGLTRRCKSLKRQVRILKELTHPFILLSLSLSLSLSHTHTHTHTAPRGCSRRDCKHPLSHWGNCRMGPLAALFVAVATFLAWVCLFCSLN